jgi:hypothetical protein
MFIVTTRPRIGAPRERDVSVPQEYPAPLEP